MREVHTGLGRTVHMVADTNVSVCARVWCACVVCVVCVWGAGREKSNREKT